MSTVRHKAAPQNDGHLGYTVTLTMLLPVSMACHQLEHVWTIGLCIYSDLVSDEIILNSKFSD